MSEFICGQCAYVSPDRLVRPIPPCPRCGGEFYEQHADGRTASFGAFVGLGLEDEGDDDDAAARAELMEAAYAGTHRVVHVIEKMFEELGPGGCEDHAAPVVVGVTTALSEALAVVINQSAVRGMSPKAVLAAFRAGLFDNLEELRGRHVARCDDPTCKRAMAETTAYFGRMISNPSRPTR